MAKPRRMGFQFLSRTRQRQRAVKRRRGRLSGALDWRAAAYESLEQRLPLAVNIQVRFEFADLQGDAVGTLHTGEDYLLKAFIQDIRSAPQGIFQAYFDVTYPAALISPTGGVSHGADYNLVPFGNTSTPGLIDEAGGIDTDQLQPSPFGAELLLFSVPFHANAEGQVDLVGDLADGIDRKTLLWETASGSQLSDIQFVGGSIAVAEPSGTPTLTTIATLPGASEDTPFPIAYATLLAASDAFDPESDPISFRIESVTTGTLTKGGTPVTPGTTLLSAGESLQWTPADDANGTLGAFTVTAFDGALASTPAVPVTVMVGAVNDVPAFLKGPDQWLNATGQHDVPNWATGISAGAANESGQVLTFDVTTDNDSLFSVLPTVDAAGTLSYTLAAGAKGFADITVVLHDDGGTAGGGQDTSAEQDFLLVVNEDSLWQNPDNPLDVDRNGVVENLDLVLIINDLIVNGLHAVPENPVPPDVPPPFLDVDANGFVFPLDALALVNYFILLPTNLVAPASALTGGVDDDGWQLASPAIAAEAFAATPSNLSAAAGDGTLRGADARFGALADAVFAAVARASTLPPAAGAGVTAGDVAGADAHHSAITRVTGSQAAIDSSLTHAEAATRRVRKQLDQAAGRHFKLSLVELHERGGADCPPDES